MSSNDNNKIMKKEPEQQVDDDERYCDNEKCPYASYICFEEFGECEECSKPATESLAYGCLSVGLCKEHYAISWAEHPANPENCFSSDEDEDEEEEEWETIYNEDYKEKQTDEDGREYLDYLTYGGGPCGGYMAYTDNNAVNSWHFEFGFDKRRLTRLHNQKLIMRRNPDMPSRYKGAQGFQVRVVEE